jgi:hypothetical protein
MDDKKTKSTKDEASEEDDNMAVLVKPSNGIYHSKMSIIEKEKFDKGITLTKEFMKACIENAKKYDKPSK